MKKSLIILVSAILCASFAACSNQADEPVDKPETLPAVTQDIKGETLPASEEVTTAPEVTDEPTEAVTEPAKESIIETTAATTEASMETAPETTTAAPVTEPAIVVSEVVGKMYALSDVNVRSGPDASYERLGHIDSEDEVNISGICENGWYRISFKGGEGFVSGKYLSSEKPAPVTTAKATSTAAPLTESPKTEAAPAPSESESGSADKFMQNIKTEVKCPDKYLGKKSGTTYGKVENKSYYSKTCETNRPVNIVLPSGYTTDKKYPVMYVLHGIFCNENTMMDSYGTHHIIQNMTAAGEAEEMIIVFPNMYAAKDPNMQPSFGDIKSVEPYDNFLNDLVNDLMPYMAKNYSVAEGKENTAIFGFSMGGRESLATGFTYPDKFGYVGAVAPAPGLTPGQDWAFKHPGQFKESELRFGVEKPYLLMICAGDKDGTVGQFPKGYHQIMDRNKVEHLWWEIPGSDHGDPAIASGTYNFAKYAFKAK